MLWPYLGYVQLSFLGGGGGGRGWKLLHSVGIGEGLVAVSASFKSLTR